MAKNVLYYGTKGVEDSRGALGWNHGAIRWYVIRSYGCHNGGLTGDGNSSFRNLLEIHEEIQWHIVADNYHKALFYLRTAMIFGAVEVKIDGLRELRHCIMKHLAGTPGASGEDST